MQDEHLSFQEKVIQILVVPSQNQEGFKFMQQSLKTLEVYPEFAELLETFRETRGRLYEFFLEGLKREGLEEKDAAAVSSMLYNYFEGMYGSGTPEEVTKITPPRQSVEVFRLFLQTIKKKEELVCSNVL